MTKYKFENGELFIFTDNAYRLCFASIYCTTKKAAIATYEARQALDSEQSGERHEPRTETMTMTYEFTGYANQDNHAAANAICNAMHDCDSDSVTADVIERAVESLGNGWDSASVSACIEDCSFTC